MKHRRGTFFDREQTHRLRSSGAIQKSEAIRRIEVQL
jgi:hypothetical protein